MLRCVGFNYDIGNTSFSAGAFSMKFFQDFNGNIQPEASEGQQIHRNYIYTYIYAYIYILVYMWRNLV